MIVKRDVEEVEVEGKHFSRPVNVKNISAKAQRKPKTASTADDEPGTSAGTLACDIEPLHSSQLSSQGLEEEAAEDEEGSLPPVVTADPGTSWKWTPTGTPTSTLETKKTKRLAKATRRAWRKGRRRRA